MPDSMIRHTMRKDLTERELEVLSLIIQEYTSREIAKKLFISKQTVDTHRLNIMQKTGSKSLVGLIKYVLQSGISGN
jgi:DNA-binding CsgD family transcriptional regulator